MKRHLFFLVSVLTIYIACSDESSDDFISDSISKDTSLDIDPVDKEEMKDIDDISFADLSLRDATEITDTTISDSGGDGDNNDIIVIQDVSTELGIGDIIITDILDIHYQDTGTDNIMYDIDIDADAMGEDITDSGDTVSLPPIVNELMIMPNYGDTKLGQYIEIYNPNRFDLDINGYKLKTEKDEFIISNKECDTIIKAYSFIVIGATKDPLKNSYAKVRCEWKDLFTLTDARQLELLGPNNLLIEKIDLTKLPTKKGASLERKGDKFEPSPSLITFLNETGLYNGDRGSPFKTNYNLVIKSKLYESEPQEDRFEKENTVYRYPADLAKGDIIAFHADVDRISGDLKLFASLLDSDDRFITPDIYISDISYDFFIYHLIKDTKRYYFQIQPDFFYKFNPANIEATYYRANSIKTTKDLIELQVGDKYQITTYATFSQNPNLKDFLIDKTLLSYSSNDPYIAEISTDGVITGKNIGTVTVYINYYYTDGTSLNTTMVVNVYNQPPNETCATALDATNGLSTYSSTIGTQDDYNPKECIFSMFSGGDIVYYVDAEPNAIYEVIVTPYASFDPMIYVYDDCSKNECLYGTVLNGAGAPEKLTFKNETFSKKRFYIIIDGEAGDEGSFQLTITKK
ncbi:MAG: lamin tail domain-containing protein [Deltaproteobacteria bacterium]|nr:lamin tail domain-containing protein [Deltaproteobacteria bacterium]